MYIYNLKKSKIMTTNFYKPFIGLGILLLTISCKIEPETIDFGKDQCSFCVMNIVDKTYILVDGFPKKEQFSLSSQITRSAVSIPSNMSPRYSSNSTIGRACGAVASTSAIGTSPLPAGTCSRVSVWLASNSPRSLNVFSEPLIIFNTNY